MFQQVSLASACQLMRFYSDGGLSAGAPLTASASALTAALLPTQ